MSRDNIKQLAIRRLRRLLARPPAGSSLRSLVPPPPLASLAHTPPTLALLANTPHRPPLASLAYTSPTPHPQLAPLATPLQVGSKTAASNRLKRPWRSDWGHGLEQPRRTDWGRGLERPQGGTLTPQKAKNSWRPRRPRRPASTDLKPPHPWVEATCQVSTS